MKKSPGQPTSGFAVNRSPRTARALLRLCLAGWVAVMAQGAAWALPPVASGPDVASGVQHPDSYVVRAGQKLDDIAADITHAQDKASRDRAANALYAANPRAFLDGQRDRLRVGAVLHVPASVYAQAGAARTAQPPAPFASLAAILAAFNNPPAPGKPAALVATTNVSVPSQGSSHNGASAASGALAPSALQATVPAALASAVYGGVKPGSSTWASSVTSPSIAGASTPVKLAAHVATASNLGSATTLTTTGGAASSSTTASGASGQTTLSVAPPLPVSAPGFASVAAASAPALIGSSVQAPASATAAAAASFADAASAASATDAASAASAAAAASAASAASAAKASALASAASAALASAAHAASSPGWTSLQGLLALKDKLLHALFHQGQAASPPAKTATGSAAGQGQFESMWGDVVSRLQNPATWYAIGGGAFALVLAVLAVWPRKKKELSADLEPLPASRDHAAAHEEPTLEAQAEGEDQAEPPAVHETGEALAEQAGEADQDADAGAKEAHATPAMTSDETALEAFASAGAHDTEAAAGESALPVFDITPELAPEEPVIEPSASDAAPAAAPDAAPITDDLPSLRAAIARAPNDTGLRVRLAQLMAQRYEMPGFIDAFYDLRTLTNAEGEAWETTLALARRLDPDNPLFQSDEERLAARERRAQEAEARRQALTAEADPRMADALAGIDLSLPTEAPPAEAQSEAQSEAPPVTAAAPAAIEPESAPQPAAEFDLPAADEPPAIPVTPPAPAPVAHSEPALHAEPGLEPELEPELASESASESAPALTPESAADRAPVPAPAAESEPEAEPVSAGVEPEPESASAEPAPEPAAVPEPATEAAAAAPTPTPTPTTPEPEVEPAAPATTTAESAPAEPETEPEPEPEPTALEEDVPTPDGLPRTMAIAGQSAAKFGVLDLDFDLDLPQQTPHAPSANLVLDPVAVSRNKLDLVHEYVTLGDLDGARALLNEVLDASDPATREAARALWDTLA